MSENLIVVENKRTVEVGQEFGMLTAYGLPFHARDTHGNTKHHVVCKCACGSYCIVLCVSLKSSPGTRSCGCARRKIASITAANRNRRNRGARNPFYKHGASGTRLYKVFLSMHERCKSESAKAYKNYGKRGIEVCDEWSEFSEFQSWALQHGYKPGLTIERKNVNGNYTPGNCCWIPKSEQNNNMRRNKRVEAFGETRNLSQWAIDPRCTVSYWTLWKRIKSGVSPELAITSPSRVS